jgi:2-iminobutanoate/2-iminopropanoate deaminase
MISGNLIFISGQLPIDPKTGEFNSSDPVEQLAQCLANISAIAEAAGSNIQKTLKTTILVTDLGRFSELNAEYAKVFAVHKPARACYQVSALPRGAQVEIEAIVEI